MLHFSLPFDQHTYFGFFLVNILQSTNVYAYFIILIMVTAYYLSICFYVEAICEDFQNVFTSIRIKACDVKAKQIEAIKLQIAATT